jgi:hypothetical protein
MTARRNAEKQTRYARDNAEIFDDEKPELPEFFLMKSPHNSPVFFI